DRTERTASSLFGINRTSPLPTCRWKNRAFLSGGFQAVYGRYASRRGELFESLRRRKHTVRIDRRTPTVSPIAQARSVSGCRVDLHRFSRPKAAAAGTAHKRSSSTWKRREGQSISRPPCAAVRAGSL